MNNGSSCGSPKMGEAYFFRILSPTSPFQSLSSIITDIVFIAAEELSDSLSFLNEHELKMIIAKKQKK